MLVFISNKVFFMKKWFACVLFSAFTISCSSFNYGSSGSSNPKPNYQTEAQEFAQLMELDSIDKKERSAEAVNLLLNESPSDLRAAILFKNQSNCDIIIRVSGNGKTYNLPVPKNKLNYIVLDKGTYSFNSKLCRAVYRDTKTLTGSIDVTLSE